MWDGLVIFFFFFIKCFVGFWTTCSLATENVLFLKDVLTQKNDIMLFHGHF